MIYVNGRFLSQPVTGVQRFAIEITKALKKKTDLCILAPSSAREGSLAHHLDATFVGRVDGHLWEQITLPRYLDMLGRPPLLNLGNLAPLFYRNNYLVLHDLAFWHHPEWFSRFFSTYYKLMVPILIRRSKHVFCVSDYVKRDVERVFDTSPDAVSVCFNAVPSVFEAILPQSANSERRPYLLVVGSLDPRKNLTRTLSAFSQVKGDVDLVIVGRKSKIFSDPNIQALSALDERVHFTGYVSDRELGVLYANALAFIYPSLFEGFGIPPLEAQFFGCPVLVSNRSSLPEVFLDSAYYCEPENIGDIAQKMISLVEDVLLRQRLSEKGRVNIGRFSWERSAQIILDKVATI